MKTKKPDGQGAKAADKKKKRTQPPAAKPRASKEPSRNGVGAIQSLAAFLGTAGALSLAERQTIIEQALVMIEQVYVHLPLKRAMHAIDPVQRLRLLGLQVASLTERAFHDEMVSIYTQLRDLHTNYVLPEPYRSRVAFLPFQVEEFFEKGERQYLVTQVSSAVTDKNFKPGVVPTHWNGVPIDRMVERNAEREAGSNLAARHARGLESLTNRWMGMSLPPDEEWVVLRYRTDDTEPKFLEFRSDWQVIVPGAPEGGIDPLRATGAAGAGLGLDAKAEIQRRVRKMIFSEKAMQAEAQMSEVTKAASSVASYGQLAHAVGRAVEAFGGAPGAVGSVAATAGGILAILADAVGGAVSYAAEVAKAAAAANKAAVRAGADLNTTSILPDVFPLFKTVAGPRDKKFGYIRIATFAVDDVGRFVQEFIRILSLLPQGGLILDVRGNGGGTIAAGESLLQLLTPRPIVPESFSFISSPLTQKMCQTDASLQMWSESITQSVQTAAGFSRGFPLTPPTMCNSIGQKYRGPVVLIIDARCYSTTDMFAAGFQDHGIGKIVGTAANTGAGGANVWTHEFLQEIFPGPDSPFKPVPGDASFRVAIRRSMRSSGAPLEDLGVAPDVPVYPMTADDLLKGNVDLIQHVASILDTMPAYTLDAELTDGTASGASIQVRVTTANLDRLDVFVNNRPQLTMDVTDGPHSFTLPPSGSATLVELRGFKGDALAASARIPLASASPQPSGTLVAPSSAAPSTSIQALLAVSPADRDLAWLKESLREAIQLEFSTIPPYLCAWWSVQDPDDPVASIIHDVVLEEMLHMGLACNLLAGLKDKPPINSKAFVPAYPCELPGGVHPNLIVSLVGLSIPIVRNIFMQIEKPLDPIPVGGAMAQTYSTIGEFYDALLACFKKINPPLDPAWQRTEPILGLQKITDLDGVEKAITLIKVQGEGTTQSLFTDGGTPAHYYLFQQIAEQKVIVKGDDGKPKWGGPLKFPAVINMASVPKGGWQDAEVSRPFNRHFTAMLALMEEAWSNDDAVGKQKLKLAIKTMRELTPLARDLMKKPLVPGGSDFYGPSFQYDPEPTANP